MRTAGFKYCYNRLEETEMQQHKTEPDRVKWGLVATGYKSSQVDKLPLCHAIGLHTVKTVRSAQ